MKLKQKFSQLTIKEYFFFIDNYKKYADFNSLGLYRSLLETEKLTLEEKRLVRDYAHQTFRKSFDFLPLKDPVTYVGVSTLGQELTTADQARLWEQVRDKQRALLQGKRLGHRSFGTYSKHLCGHPGCQLDGLMVRRNSGMAYHGLHLPHDKESFATKKLNSIQQKRRGRRVKRILRTMQEPDAFLP